MNTKLNFRKLSIIVASFILSLIGVSLFYKAELGSNFVLFNLIFIVLLNISAHYSKRHSRSLVISSLILGSLTLPFALTSTGITKVLLFIVWLYFLSITIYNLIQVNHTLPFWRYLSAPFEVFTMTLIAPLFTASKLKVPSRKSSSVVLRILIGVIIAIPFLIVFFMLLLSADLVFKQITQNIFGYSFIKDTVSIILWFLVGLWISLGMLYYHLVKREKNEIKEIANPKKSFFIIESSTILVLVELLFLIFNIIQVTYLFGGEALITGGEFTYSEYAVKGFWELIAVSIIALGLITVLLKIKKTTKRWEKLLIRTISLFGILELIPMVISAFYRLYMYEDAYGYTRLRIFAHAGIIFLCIVFVWYIIKLTTKLKESFFVYGLEIITMLSILIFGLVNTDGMIAKHNINRYLASEKDSEKIDIEYLNTLSYDAIPQLLRLYKESDGNIKEEIAFYLESKYAEMKFMQQEKDIRSFSYRHWNNFELLEEYIYDIEKYSKNYEDSIIKSYYNDIDPYIYYDQSYYSSECSNAYITVIAKSGGEAYAYNQFTLYDVDTLEKVTTIHMVDACIGDSVENKEYYIELVTSWNYFEKEYQMVEVTDDPGGIIVVSRNH